MVHDLTGWPSTDTTQVPQLEVSQPQWVPVPGGLEDNRDTQAVAGREVAAGDSGAEELAEGELEE